MKSRRALKNEAKELLSGNWLTAIKLNIVPVIGQVVTGAALLGAFSWLAYYFISYTNFADGYFNWGVNDSGTSGQSFISELITTYLLVSVDFALIDWVRTKSPITAPFKHAFQAFTGRYLVPTFVLFVVQWVLIFLWSLLLLVPGIIKSFSYSQTYFIYKDLQSQGQTAAVSYLDCVTLSRRLMDGHKWEFFLLRLSFIGWDILGWLMAGIAFIWITPYKHMTYMNYYVSLAQGHDFVAELNK